MTYSADFESCYDLWPKKAEKYEASLEWEKQRKKSKSNRNFVPEIMAALEWQVPIYSQRDSVKVVPSFRRWLHNFGWNEEAVDGVGKFDKNGGDPNRCRECGLTFRACLCAYAPK